MYARLCLSILLTLKVGGAAAEESKIRGSGSTLELESPRSSCESLAVCRHAYVCLFTVRECKQTVVRMHQTKHSNFVKKANVGLLTWFTWF